MRLLRSKIFWILSIFLLILSVLFYSFYSSSKIQFSEVTNLFGTTNSDSIEEKPTYEYKNITYFVPISGVESQISNITFAELKTKQINVLAENLVLLKQVEGFSDLNYIEFTTFEELSASLSEDKSKIGIINFNDLNFRVKTLSYEGILLFDKTTKTEDYMLKLTQTLTSDKKEIDQSNYDPKELRIVGHTGSIIGARGVQYTAETRYKGDYTKLFESTKPLFDKMDFVSATMEAPFMGKGRECDGCMSFLGPDKIMDGVKYAGIDLLSTAANHIMDGGMDGLANTQKKIDEAGILQTGSSLKNNDEAGKPVLANINGLKIAYLAVNDTPGRGQWAGENNPGAASISDWEVDSSGRTIKYAPNEERIKYFLQRAKDLNPDLIFVIPHWGGKEYTQMPLEYTRTLAKLLIKHGADAILGDHPHWVQQMELIDGKPVWYCVGNYIFDQTWSEETKQGLSIEMHIYQNKIINFKLHPHYTKIQGVPELVQPTDPKYQTILNRVWDVSDVK